MLEMTTENCALWARLEAFDLDESGAFLPFSARMARDNGWSEEFARRVCDEYKKFVFLAMEAGHPVTPSDEVDQAWHQHLTYTRSYWDEMCGEILGKPLHHGPTRGGSAEGQKFRSWYCQTLESYREFFGEEPPRDIWPPSEVRFGEAAYFRRVNTQRVWLLPKLRLRAGLPHIGDKRKMVPLVFALFLAGCAEAQNVGPNVFDWHGGPFLIFFWILSAIGIGFSMQMKRQSLRPLDAVFPTEPLDAYEVARLRDSKNLATDVALAMLYERGCVEITASGTLRATGMNGSLKQFERAVLSRVGRENSVLDARRSLHFETGVIDQRLRDLGLLVSRETERMADNWPIGITLGLLFLGGSKIAVGLSRDRPVGFLFLSCAVLTGFLIYFLTHSARRSRRGDLYLQQLTSQKLGEPARCDDFEAVALGFALMGVAAFPPEVQRAMRPPSGGDSGGSGCSSSSGGDGGGGGCGGCGGGGD
jgi:uncharacterized protein (TIGR04222 family)